MVVTSSKTTLYFAWTLEKLVLKWKTHFVNKGQNKEIGKRQQEINTLLEFLVFQIVQVS
jgi:hypothetical protein